MCRESILFPTDPLQRVPTTFEKFQKLCFWAVFQQAKQAIRGYIGPVGMLGLQPTATISNL